MCGRPWTSADERPRCPPAADRGGPAAAAAGGARPRTSASPCAARNASRCARVDGVSFTRRQGRDARHRGRVRLRQVHHGPAHRPPDGPRRAANSSSTAKEVGQFGGLALKDFRQQLQMVFQDSLRVAQPAAHDPGRRGLRPAGARRAEGRGRSRVRARPAGPRGPVAATGFARALSARDVRRPAPARQHRAGAGLRAAAADPRRGRGRARQVGARPRCSTCCRI